MLKASHGCSGRTCSWCISYMRFSRPKIWKRTGKDRWGTGTLSKGYVKVSVPRVFSLLFVVSLRFFLPDIEYRFLGFDVWGTVKWMKMRYIEESFVLYFYFISFWILLSYFHSISSSCFIFLSFSFTWSLLNIESWDTKRNQCLKQRLATCRIFLFLEGTFVWWPSLSWCLSLLKTDTIHNLAKDIKIPQP